MTMQMLTIFQIKLKIAQQKIMRKIFFGGKLKQEKAKGKQQQKKKEKEKRKACCFV